MNKRRTIEELRQTKDSVYKPPVSHQEYEYITHRFTNSTLVEYITNCLREVNGEVYDADTYIIQEFVNNNKI